MSIPQANNAYSIFLPISEQFINPPIFILFRFLAFPYFDHDAFTLHAQRVLGAHVYNVVTGP